MTREARVRRNMASLDTVRTLIKRRRHRPAMQAKPDISNCAPAEPGAALKQEAQLLQREFQYPANSSMPAELRDNHAGGTQSHGALRIPDALAVHPLKLRSACCAWHAAPAPRCMRQARSPDGAKTARSMC